MTDSITSCLFLCDALMVGIVAWMGVCAVGLNVRGLLESSLGWGLLVFVWIVGSGVLLGLMGWLGSPGFILLHTGGLIILGWSRRQKWREDIRLGQAWLVGWWKLVGGGTVEGALIAGLLVIMLGLTGLVAFAEPVVYDALTYRLSRIGLWLQDGYITYYATDDPRLNYMPVGPDVVIAWLLGATKQGFHLAPLNQLAGGMLLLGATFGLAREAGLERRTALGAVVLVLGMANVGVQFTTIHSDLFTAGLFSAGYLLWHRALVRGEGSVIAGAGIGLALGSKGTLLYLAPGALAWVGWLAWKHWPGWRALQSTAVGAGLAVAIFVVPGYWRNLAAYGNFFGPHEAIILHHGESLTLAEHTEKLQINLGTSAVQLLDPNSQPFWSQELFRKLGRKLLPMLSTKADAYVFARLPRRLQVEMVMELREPDADLVTCGVLATMLFLGGLVAAIILCTRDRSAPLVLVWSIGLMVYLLVQHALVQWHQWGFRFMVLGAPWMGVVGAWGLSRLSRRLQLVFWPVVAASALQVFAAMQWRANQAGWQALARPDRTVSHYVYRQWREWAGTLAPDGSPLTVALPINQPLAAFVRTDPVRRIKLLQLSKLPATAEEAVRSLDGWLIVPGRHFIGREGRVEKRVGRYFSDEPGAFSLVAYRRVDAEH